VGNVAEMTFDPFKMTVGNRLHGAAGGFVRKGGSFRSHPDEIQPGRRLERALFYRNGPATSNDMGFRLALSAVAAPGGTRFKELADEWEAIGQTPQSELDANSNPMEKLNALIESAGDDSEKKALESLRADFRDFSLAVTREKMAAVRAHCKSIIHAIYGIRSNSRRKQAAQVYAREISDEIKQINSQMASASPSEKAQLRQYITQMKVVEDQNKEDVKNFDMAIRNQFGYYQILINDAIEFDPQMLKEQMAFVNNDIKGDDFYNKDLRFCYEWADAHLKNAAKGLSRNNKLDDIVGRELPK
jgi:hypothetical protein